MSAYYLAMYGDKVSILDSVFISLFAMTIVFFVLLIISYMIDGIAFFVKKINKKNTDEKTNANLLNENKENNIAVADSSVDVAVIAAAVAMYMNTSVDNIIIRKIRRV